MATPLLNSSVEKMKIQTCSEYVKTIQDTMQKIHGQIRNRLKQHELQENHNQERYRLGEFVMAKILPRIHGLNKARYDGPYEIIGKRGKWCYVLKNTKTCKVIERN